MNKLKSHSRFQPWFAALLLAALAAGCGGGGGGGQDPILGTGGISGAPPAVTPGVIIPGVPAGSVAPGVVCPAGAGPLIPTVTSSDPTNGDLRAFISTAGVPNSGKSITATFSLAMDPATINSNPAGTRPTFTLKNTTTGGSIVAGTVLLNAAGTVATFTTAAALIPGNSYTAIITTPFAESAATNTPLACTYAWDFATRVSTATGQAPVILGPTLSKYGVIAGSGVASTGPTKVTGASGTTADLGSFPTGTVNGFPPGTVNGTIIPSAFIHQADADAGTAKDELTAAFVDAQGRSVDAISLPGNLGGLTLAPGLYVNSSSSGINGTGANAILTLDAQGDANAVFIFKMGSTLVTTTGTSIVLSNSAQAKNIFWQVGSSATLGTNSVFAGNILAQESITLTTGAVLNGRALTRTAAVTLDSNIITVPLP